VPPGTALTEFYDVVELKSHGRTGAMQAEFCKSMSDWRPFPHHRRIMDWALRHRAPVLTTNFDDVLSQAAYCDFQFPRDPKFTAYYPWSCHFARHEIDDPCDDFGIWHINGMSRYKTSIRLGLSHYMGSVRRAGGWIHGRSDENLFRAKNRREWQGARTWMHLVFNKPLLFVGLGLAENEVFLRWLLIRAGQVFPTLSRSHTRRLVCLCRRPARRAAGRQALLPRIRRHPLRRGGKLQRDLRESGLAASVASRLGANFSYFEWRHGASFC